MPSGIPNSSPVKSCEQCLSLFKYKPSVEKKGHARFCSRICQNIWQSGDRKGRRPYEMTKKTREKIRAFNMSRKGKPSPKRGIPQPHTQGERNHNWKGKKASYSSIHKWINKYLGKPTQCRNCYVDGLTGRKIHWANISQEYKRNFDDWIRLCAKCHKAYDTGKLALIGKRG